MISIYDDEVENDLLRGRGCTTSDFVTPLSILVLGI